MSANTQTRAAETQPAWLPAAPFLFLLMWSAGYPVSKIGLHYAAPTLFLAIRYGLVLTVLAAAFLALRPPLPKRRMDYVHIGVVGFLIQAVYFGGCYWAFAIGTSSGVVALIVSLQPLLVAVLAPLLVKEVTGLKGWAGLTLGFVGAAIVILGYERVGHVPLAGIGGSVLALFGMSAATLYEKRFGTGAHPVTANLVQYAVGFAVTLPFALIFGPFHVQWSVPFVAAMSYLVLCNSIIAISLLLAMIRFGRASRVSALFFLVPPVAALMAWALLGEPMPPPVWVGMAVAGAGLWLVNAKPKRA